MANAAQRRKHRRILRESAPLRCASSARVRVVGTPLDEAGMRWPIVLIAAGESLNAGPTGKKLYYTADALREAAHLFEGAKSYADHPSRSQAQDLPERSIRDIVGFVSDVKFDESTGSLVGVWNITDPALNETVRRSNILGKLDLIGFSINTAGTTAPGVVNGTEYELVTSIDPSATTSVDAVTEPAAGGRFLTRLAASLRASKEVAPMTWELFRAAKAKLAEAILSKKSNEAIGAFVAELELPFASDSERAAFVEAATMEANPAPPADMPPPAAQGKTVECKACHAQVPMAAGIRFCPGCGSGLQEVVQPAPVAASKAADEALATANAALAEARKLTEAFSARAKADAIDAEIAAAGLPAATAADVRPLLESATSADARAKVIALAKRTIREASFSFPTGTTRDLGVTTAGDDAFDTYLHAFDGYLSGQDEGPEGKKVARFRSLREAILRQPRFGGRYVDMQPLELLQECRGWYKGGYRAGERASFGLREGRHVKLAESNHVWLREAVTTSGFAEIWADRAYKRMMKLYHSSNDVNQVLALASDKEELPDFKTTRIIRLGEYANPSSVVEGGTYQPASTPADNEEVTSLTKYGFFETLTMESLLGEDGKKIRTLQDRLIQAIMRLERETIINRITTTNPTLNSDSIALYHASHGNTGTTALTIGELAVIERIMMQQTSLTAAAQLGSINRPKWLIIPPEHLQLAERIVHPSVAYYGAVTDPGASTVLDPHLFKDRLEILVADHFTNATDYFLMADPAKMPTFQVSRLQGVGAPEFFTQDSEDSPSMFDADKINWKVRTFLGVEPLDFRSFYREDVA